MLLTWYALVVIVLGGGFLYLGLVVCGRGCILRVGFDGALLFDCDFGVLCYFVFCVLSLLLRELGWFVGLVITFWFCLW